MGESGGIDSSGGRTMPKAYSADIRMRVIARVEGGASRREAAEQLDISPSAAVKWVKCFHETGNCAAKPRGGSTSPLEVHAPWLLTLIEEQPDLTLDEVVSAMHKHGIAGSRTALWSFFKRHNISFKKSLRAAEQDRPDVARARRCWKRRQVLSQPSPNTWPRSVVRRVRAGAPSFATMRRTSPRWICSWFRPSASSSSTFW